MTEKECLTMHIPTLNNLSEICTKVLDGQKIRNLVKVVLCDIYDHDQDD